MSLRTHRATRSRRVLLPAGSAASSGADRHAPPSAPTPTPPSRIVLTVDDLLWYKTSNDHEGRITLGLMAFSPEAVGVLVDDNGESLGLRLSRTEAQDLHRTLVTWLSGTS